MKPSMKNSLLTPIMAILVAFVVTQNCSPVQTSSSQYAAQSLNPLGISPIGLTIGTGTTLQFTGTGGNPPYSFSLINGTGTISSTGFYTAPSTVTVTSTTNTETVTIQITDSLGQVQTTGVIISSSSGSGITASYTPNPAPTSTLLTLTPSGGTAPYTYTLISGGGTLSLNTYTTPNYNETATIQLTDASNNSGVVSITVSGSNGSITAVYITQLGTNIPGGGGCPASYQQVGAVADVGQQGIYGDQVICGQVGTQTAGTTVLANLYVTAGGTHASAGLSCPAGYSTVIGTLEDCESTGTCGGLQNVCGFFAAYQTNMTIVTNFYVTPENQHAVGGVACANGYSQVGTVADCGGGTCYGTQSVCVLYGL